MLSWHEFQPVPKVGRATKSAGCGQRLILAANYILTEVFFIMIELRGLHKFLVKNMFWQVWTCRLNANPW